MAAIALVLVGLLALAVALLLAAQIEMFRDIRQLRDALGILDRPIPVEVRHIAGHRPSAYGLPRGLDALPSAVVLFLSDRCGTCRQLANGVAKPLPDNLWIVLEGSSSEAARAFAARYRLDEDPRVVIDDAGAIARRLGLELTPVGIRVEHGAIASATTVPSARYLNSIIPELIFLKPAV